MSNNLNNLPNEEISDLLDDASKSGTPHLTTKQVEHLCTIASIEITNADTNVAPDQLMAIINDNMAKYILKSTKPTAICDAMKEINKYQGQVTRWEKKLKQVNEYLDEQEKLVNDGRMSRSSAQLLKAKKEQVSAKNSKPPGDTEVRWEMKKKLVLAYNKYITFYEDLLRQERVKQSAEQIAADMDEVFNTNNNNNVPPPSPLQEITSRIESNNNIARSNSSTNAKVQADRGEEYMNKIKQVSTAKKQEEADQKLLHKQFMESIIEKNKNTQEIVALKKQLLQEKIDLVRTVKKQKMDEQHVNIE
jgi:hypothetical protein